VLPENVKAALGQCCIICKGPPAATTLPTAVWCMQVFKATFQDPNISDEQLQVRPL
jgi:hypothetical protein